MIQNIEHFREIFFFKLSKTSNIIYIEYFREKKNIRCKTWNANNTHRQPNGELVLVDSLVVKLVTGGRDVDLGTRGGRGARGVLHRPGREIFFTFQI